MKLIFLLISLVAVNAFANECKTTTITVEKNNQIEVETATVCKEGKPIERKVNVGDIILENEVGKSKVTDYFSYRNTKCRMFTEHTVQNQSMRIYHGVICQVNKGNDWLVVDKW